MLFWITVNNYQVQTTLNTQFLHQEDPPNPLWISELDAPLPTPYEIQTATYPLSRGLLYILLQTLKRPQQNNDLSAVSQPSSLPRRYFYAFQNLKSKFLVPTINQDLQELLQQVSATPLTKPCGSTQIYLFNLYQSDSSI